MIYLEDLIRVRTSAAELDLAVTKALEHFGCSRAEVEIEILEPGRRGWLGLGRRDAQISARLVDRAFVARLISHALLEQSGFQAVVTVSQSSEQVELSIATESTAQLIGKHGQTLEALQYLVSNMTDRVCPGDIPLVLDAGGYRLKRHRYLQGLARKLSAKVRASGDQITLDPLPHHERRLLHTFFRDQRGVTSLSVGKGYDKRVIVAPEG